MSEPITREQMKRLLIESVQADERIIGLVDYGSSSQVWLLSSQPFWQSHAWDTTFASSLPCVIIGCGLVNWLARLYRC